jgi:glycosyltransferase involved in cell wall biosynthesis
MGAKTLKCIKEFDIDIISANWAIPPGFVSTILKSIHRKPILLILYGAELFPLLRRNNIFNNICKVMAKYAITNSSAVAGISVATCDAGMKLSGRSDLKILTDGIDVEVFNPYIDASDIKLKYKNDFKIFTSGRMVERKWFRYLLESIPYVLREIPNCKFILGGEGPEKVSLQETAKKLGVVNHVIFPGYISNEDFPKYLKACDIFVLPSIIDKSGDTEGLGIPLIEAMACGTPVIGTNVGGIPFIINDGIGGYLIDEKNPKQLANKIILLLRDMNLRRNISEKGLIYVKDKFSSDKIAEDYIELFKSLVR